MAYNCPHCKEAIADAVSKGEIQRKIEKHNTLTSALEKQITDLESSARKNDRTHKAALQELRESLSNGHASALAMARLGLDDDAAAVAELLHGRLPAEDRPELTAWLQAQKEAPDTAHPLLRAYFGDAAPVEAASTETPSTPSTPSLPSPAGVSPLGTPPAWTPEQIRGMSSAEFAANAGALSDLVGFDVASSFGLVKAGA